MLRRCFIPKCSSSSSSIPHVCIISSHHIYNDEKKEYIILEAVNRDLSGVYLFGKPGRIVVEGSEFNVKSYSREIRSWRWQKITEMAEVMPSHVWLERSQNKSKKKKNINQLQQQSSSSSKSNKKQKHGNKSKMHDRLNDESSVDDNDEITEYSRIFEENRFIQVATDDELKEFLMKRKVGAIAKELSRPFSATRELGRRK